VIKAEAGVTLGSMDVLLVDHKAIPTIIETKLVDNREIRRSVLAQGVEYLAHLQREWLPDRIMEAGRTFWDRRGVNFDAVAQEQLGFSFDRDFMDRLAANIKSHRLRLIIAADRIPSELRTVIEFLNEASAFDVFGLEVRLYAAPQHAHRILAAQLVGVTARSRDGKPGDQGSRWNRERFFSALEEASSPEVAVLAEDLMQFGTEITGRPVEWGSGRGRGSFTARLVLEDERYSLFSVYTTGQFSVNIGWNRSKLLVVSHNLSEEYRRLARERLSLDFSRNSWEHGWPMAKLSALLPDEAQGFKAYMRDFVAQVRSLPASSGSSQQATEIIR
jgi:hypothetical protein